MKKILNFSLIILSLLGLLLFQACSKKIPSSYGKFDKSYSCVGLFPIDNDTSFEPLSELLRGYFTLEMYQKGLQEILDSREAQRIFKNDGKVYFPNRFNKPLAIEYATLLGLDGVFYGTLSSPDRSTPNFKGSRKPLNMELYFLNVKSQQIEWSFSERLEITPGEYNKDIKKLTEEIVASILRSGFDKKGVDMPCIDITLAENLRKLPSLTRETFNSLSIDVANAKEPDLWMSLGNIFMSLGKRNLALAQYQKYLVKDPTSPFKGEVERQVAVIEKIRP